MTARVAFLWAIAALGTLTTAVQVGAQSALAGDPITIQRARGPIVVDGDLSDEGWRGATRIDRWYEAPTGVAP